MNRCRQEGNRDVEQSFIIYEVTEITFLAIVELDKTVSLRESSQELQMTRELLQKILKKHGLSTI